MTNHNLTRFSDYVVYCNGCEKTFFYAIKGTRRLPFEAEKKHPLIDKLHLKFTFEREQSKETEK